MLDKLTKTEKWVLLAILILLFPGSLIVAPLVLIAMLLAKK